MAYPNQPASATYNALEWIFGSLANVRVLRVLASHQGALSAPVIAEQSRLTRAGAWNALNTLTAAGIVIGVGSGRSVLHQFDPGHPFAKPIIQLFSAERERFTRFFERVKKEARKIGPGIEAVWLFGSLAREEDLPLSDLDIAVLVRTARDRNNVELLRNALQSPASELRVKPSILSMTVRELRDLTWERPEFWESLVRDAVVLVGQPPDAYTE